MSIDSLTTAARAAGYAMAASEDLFGDELPDQLPEVAGLRQAEGPGLEPPRVADTRNVRPRPQPFSDWLAFWRVPA